MSRSFWNRKNDLFCVKTIQSRDNVYTIKEVDCFGEKCKERGWANQNNA